MPRVLERYLCAALITRHNMPTKTGWSFKTSILAQVKISIIKPHSAQWLDNQVFFCLIALLKSVFAVFGDSAYFSAEIDWVAALLFGLSRAFHLFAASYCYGDTFLR